MSKYILLSEFPDDIEACTEEASVTFNSVQCILCGLHCSTVKVVVLYSEGVVPLQEDSEG